MPSSVKLNKRLVLTLNKCEQIKCVGTQQLSLLADDNKVNSKWKVAVITIHVLSSRTESKWVPRRQQASSLDVTKPALVFFLMPLALNGWILTLFNQSFLIAHSGLLYRYFIRKWFLEQIIEAGMSAACGKVILLIKITTAENEFSWHPLNNKVF